MKGIIFTEFNEMVESAFGFDVLDEIIEKAELPSGGNYTAVGTYDHQEIVSLVTELSRSMDIPVPKLLFTFGEHLFHRFAVLYPAFLDGSEDALGFLSQVENHIHVEVLKLYPHAELPRFDTKMISDTEISMTYHSNKHMEDLAEGLIHGCLNHFGNQGKVTRHPASDGSDGTEFRIVKTS